MVARAAGRHSYAPGRTGQGLTGAILTGAARQGVAPVTTNDTMNIIMTTRAPDLDGDVDPRFGRGAFLLSVDPATLDWQAFPNPGIDALGGAGIKAAQFVAQHQAAAVISGDFGPHAFAALQAAHVPMYLFGESRTARDALARYQAGQLQQVGAATRDDCHSPGEAHG